jgi:hypothetical protein
MFIFFSGPHLVFLCQEWLGALKYASWLDQICFFRDSQTNHVDRGIQLFTFVSTEHENSGPEVINRIFRQGYYACVRQKRAYARNGGQEAGADAGEGGESGPH